mgnify:CR=1 FL=1
MPNDRIAAALDPTDEPAGIMPTNGMWTKLAGTIPVTVVDRAAARFFESPLLLQGDTHIATKISAKIQNGLLVLGDAHSVRYMNARILREGTSKSPEASLVYSKATFGRLLSSEKIADSASIQAGQRKPLDVRLESELSILAQKSLVMRCWIRNQFLYA